VAQHLPRKCRLVSSSSLQRGYNGSLTLHITVRCRLRVLCLVRRYTSVLISRRHCRKANCVSPGVTWVTSSLACRHASVLRDTAMPGYIPLFRHPLFRHPLFRHLCLLCILAKYTHYNISFINRALISNRFPTCPSSRSCWNDWLASKQLLRYLKDNDLLPDLQSAYRGHQ